MTETTPPARRRKIPKPTFRRWLSRGPLALFAAMGPGLIAANAGNDASGVATYASVGAEYGFTLLWAMVLITISLAVVQEMAARMGAATGKGFAELVREQFGVRITALIMAALVLVNSSLVVAEFAGIGAAAELFGLSRYLVIPASAFGLWYLIMRGSYAKVERVLLLLSLAFFSYPIAAILARPDWGAVGSAIVRPSISLDARYLTLFIAMVGTTVTPYMQLYLQSAVAEKSGRADPKEARLGAYSGAVFANIVASLIIVATGATLFITGSVVKTAEDAARALEPVAGPAAPYVFGAGLFGASMLAAAVLPLTTSYTVTEAFGFEKGISRTFREAPVFLGLFTGIIAIGAILAMIPGIDVIQLLVSTQVLNGLVLPVILVSIVRLASNRDIMGRHRNSRTVNILAWATVAFVATLSSIYLVITLLGLVGLI